MKYLKSYNESASLLYTEIHEVEYDELQYVGVTIEFYNRELDKIRESLKEKRFLEINKGLPGVIDIQYQDETRHEVYVSKHEDEWYIVWHLRGKYTPKESTYYKCDQIEGLVNLLSTF